MSEPQNPVAVWQCPNCQRLQTLTFWNGVSAYTVNRQCGCVVVSEHGCFSYRRVFQMVPLNDLARRTDEWESAEKKRKEVAQQRKAEELACWPPSPANWWLWERA